MTSDTETIIEQQITFLKVKSSLNELTLEETVKLEKLQKLQLLMNDKPTDIIKTNVLSLADVETKDLINKLNELRSKT